MKKYKMKKYRVSYRTGTVAMAEGKEPWNTDSTPKYVPGVIEAKNEKKAIAAAIKYFTDREYYKTDFSFPPGGHYDFAMDDGKVNVYNDDHEIIAVYYDLLAVDDSKVPKYEILYDVPEWQIFERDGHKIYPIRALKDFGKVKAGFIGGSIESEDNLSQDGDAWVDDYAEVYGNARVYDNAVVAGAIIHGNAKIYGNAKICGDAAAWISLRGSDEVVEVCGDAEVYGDAVVGHTTKVDGNAQICGNAVIKFAADYLYIQGLGGYLGNSGRGSLTAFADNERGIAVKTANFFGSIKEFKKKVEEIGRGTDFADLSRQIKQDYTAVINLIEAHFGELKEVLDE